MFVVCETTGIRCLPVLLLPLDWQLEENRLIFRADRVRPALNPAAVRPVRRLTRLAEDDLLHALDPDETGDDLAAAGRRLGHLQARIGDGAPLAPGGLAEEFLLQDARLGNAAAVFLPDEASFTRRVAEDLDRLAGWPADRLAATALAHVLPPGRPAPPARLADPLELSGASAPGLTDPQFAAADAALSGAATVIQGPPGTGKSAVIVCLIASALAAGKSVLLAARNHRALDEVESRLQRLLEDGALLVRARDAEGERDTDLFAELSALADGGAAGEDDLAALDHRRRILREAARARAAYRRAEAARTRLQLALADALERQEALVRARAAAGPPGVIGRLRALLAEGLERLRPSAGRGGADPRGPRPLTTAIARVRGEIRRLRRKLRRPGPAEPDAVDAGPHLAALARALARPDADTLVRLCDRRAEITFQRGKATLEHLTAEDAQRVLRHRPVWLISTRSVSARLPLLPGLFDLAIFDEASQCDIASALAVMARARSVVVAGDPEQLTFVPDLGKEQEQALMDAAGLPRAGRAAWAQSRNSLFDLARRRLPEAHHFLPDQFRSAPDIVAYTSEVFYAGRLQARRAEDSFRPPRGFRPGLHWQDVTGPCSREDGGNVNRAEAAWIAGRLADLAREEGFAGSVGVVSPFNAQVGLIRRLAEERLPDADRARIQLNIDTVDGWQGGEADVIFLSLAVGQGATASALEFLRRDRRRFNVAVSRARAVAVVVGDLGWSRTCGIAHLEILARRATEPAPSAERSFDSLWERRLHEALTARGLDPKPQYPVGRRRLDFALFHNSVKLDLEVDGRKWHTGAGGARKTADRLRDHELIGLGWQVRRFWVDDLARDMEGCLDIVERDLGLRS